MSLNSINKPSIAVFCLILAVLSCVCGSNLLPFNVGVNFYFFRWFMLIIFLVSLTNIVVRRNTLKMHDFTSFYFMIFMLVWQVYSIFLLFFSSYKVEGLKAISVLFFAYLCVYVFQYLFKLIGENWFTSVSWGVFVAYLASILVAFWEITTFQHLPSYYSEHLTNDAQFSFASTAFSGNPNDLTFFIVLSSICLFHLYHKGNPLFRIIISISLFGVNPVIIFLNESRFGLFIYIFLIIYYLVKFFWGTKQLKLLVIFFLILFIYYNDSILGFFSEVDISTHFIQFTTFKDDSNAIRFAHINNFFYYMLNTLGIGLGPGQYQAMGKNHFYYVEIVDPHNLFIEIGLDYGIYILVVFLLLLATKIIFYARYNQLFFVLSLLIILLSPVNSSYLNNNVTWLFIAIMFNGFNKKHFLSLKQSTTQV